MWPKLNNSHVWHLQALLRHLRNMPAINEKP